MVLYTKCHIYVFLVQYHLNTHLNTYLGAQTFLHEEYVYVYITCHIYVFFVVLDVGS
jgi:hypothetical protein